MPANGKWDLTRGFKGSVRKRVGTVHLQLFEAAVPIHSSTFKLQSFA